MPRRSMAWRKIQALNNPYKLEQLTALENIKVSAFSDPAAAIPATLPEKMVYSYLARLGVRFYFQFYYQDIEATTYPEDAYRPDFYLPDYNIIIEVFGIYWHSASLGTFWHLYSERREADLKRLGRFMFDGRVIIEHGIPQMIPEGSGNNGKCVIWWEDEIYWDLGHLFARDLPELFSGDLIRGKPEQYILDRERELERKRRQKARFIRALIRPQIEPLVKEERRLRKRTKNLLRRYSLWRQVEEEIRPKRPKGVYDRRGHYKRTYV